MTLGCLVSSKQIEERKGRAFLNLTFNTLPAPIRIQRCLAKNHLPLRKQRKFVLMEQVTVELQENQSQPLKFHRHHVSKDLALEQVNLIVHLHVIFNQAQYY